jgi:hypothetical protein
MVREMLRIWFATDARFLFFAGKSVRRFVYKKTEREMLRIWFATDARFYF